MLNRRKFVLSLSLFGAFLWLPLAAQEGKTQKAFSGTWEGKFKGTVFCVLKLEAGSPISGMLSPGRISVNDDGDITEAEPSNPEPPGKDFPILNPKVEDGKLSFEWKEGEADNETMKFEMKLTGESEAELRFVGIDNPVKPIHLKKK
jgi:hypothetical protein